MAEDEVDNVVQLEEWRDAHVSGGDASLDDDTLIDRAGKQIAEWKTSGTQV